MKCPKCEYLGFDTGDRCKNCGYNFILSLATGNTIPDLDLRTEDDLPEAPDAWMDYLNRDVGAAAEPEEVVPSGADAVAMVDPPGPAPAAPALPLFMTTLEGDDAPLVKLPARPRTPLAVRRTPEIPRLRNIAKAAQMEPEPAFEFAEDDTAESAAIDTRSPRSRITPARPAALLNSGPGRRLLAAAIDHAILLAVDTVVLYFTLKMAALTFADWRLVPVAPLLVFLLLIKFAYFSAFTAVGGQTIGKMGAGIRVIAEDGALIDASRALRRSLAGAVSFLTLGAAFAPALFSGDGRALHDRVAHTRVVAL